MLQTEIVIDSCLVLQEGGEALQNKLKRTTTARNKFSRTLTDVKLSEAVNNEGWARL